MGNIIYHVITTISRGGAENQLLTLARQQVLNGDKVNVVFLKSEPELLLEFQNSGIKVLNALAGKSFLKQVWIFSKMKFPPGSVVHSHLPRAELLCFLSRIKSPYVVTRHNSEAFFPGAPKKLSNFLSRKVIRKARTVIAISEAVSNYIKTNHEIYEMDFGKLIVIYYGASSENYKIRFRKSSVTERIILGTAARLTEQKDIPTLLRGFKIILLTYPDARLRIAGDGPLKSSLVQFTSKLGIEKNVDWLGSVSNMDSFYSDIDCFILSSKYEGFGLVLLEALEYGLPIVATRTTSIPEVVGDNGGLLFEVGNPYELAVCVRSVLGTTEQPGIELNPVAALKKFSIEVTTARITNVYEAIAGWK